MAFGWQSGDKDTDSLSLSPPPTADCHSISMESKQSVYGDAAIILILFAGIAIQVICIERLPFGVFADLFELQHPHQRGVFTDVAVFGQDTNLELPSFLSNQSVVEVHMKVDLNSLLIHRSGLEILLELPLHARYPRLDESGYSVVEFGDPDLFMHCCVEGKLHNQSCLYIPVTDSAESRADAAVWRIPSGRMAHTGVVSAVTFISASLSALLNVLTSVRFSDIRSHKSLKRS